jgi:Tfp pilus assembly PilM family ATPase
MPRLLAIEWDAREARVAIAQPRGQDITLEDAFTIDLTPPGSEQLSAQAIGEKISSALAARNAGRGEVLVAVGRATIELQQMTLPPAPPEELPELVRFQALRQFTTISPEWPLDFVPLQATDDGNPKVLAAAISPELVQQIRTTCQAGDLSAKRLILRPFAAASLLGRRDRATHQPPLLMVDILTDEADLTVLEDEQLVLMRTVRLPAVSSSAEGTGGTSSGEGVGSAQSKALLGQIRRTVAAAQNQMRGKRIEKIVICGNGSDQVTLKEHLEKELSYEVELFDPFEQLRQGRSLKKQRPEHAGRFTPLIGMLVDEAAGSAHALDFLHPRRKPEPPNRRRQHVLIGAAVATLCLSAALLVWVQLSSKDDEIARLTEDSNLLIEKVQKAEGFSNDLARIKEFQDSNFVWLDEFYDICEALPPSDDMILSQLSVSTQAPKGGRIDVAGFTKESSQIDDVDRALRAGDRQVISDVSNKDLRRTEYSWRFKKTAILKPLSEREQPNAAEDEGQSVNSDE